ADRAARDQRRPDGPTAAARVGDRDRRGPARPLPDRSMRVMVEMQVKLPPDMPADARDALLTREREYAQSLQHCGHWDHLWRVAGRYANVSIFNVGSPDELQELVSNLPLFPYMDTRVTALAHHPSAIDRGEQS